MTAKRPEDYSDESIRNASGIIIIVKGERILLGAPPASGRAVGAPAASIEPAIEVLIESDEIRAAFEKRVREIRG